MNPYDEVTDPTARDVLTTWMGDAGTSEGRAAASARWFARDAAFDEALRRRFGTTLEQAGKGELAHWTESPHGWLALLIVLDQFPRNIHRGSPRAFETDEMARATALAGLERGDDQRLLPIERVFAYLPFEHGESLPMQDLSVRLFTALRDDAPADHADRFELFLDYAAKHRDVIVQFGRFPHRNAVLGRPDTTHEEDYLAQPGAGF